MTLKYHRRMGSVARDPLMHLFHHRVATGMSQCGWEPKPTVLMREWTKRYGEKKTPSRPTFYDWFKAQTAKIDIPNLYLLSDLLDVNARWLALGPPISITKPLNPDPDMKIVIDAYQALQPEFQEELRTEANKLLRLQGKTSKAKPY